MSSSEATGSDSSTPSAPFVPNEKVLFKENNAYLNLDKRQKGYEIVYEFIKFHPICRAFTKVVHAPKDRLIKFWRTMTFPMDGHYNKIQGDMGTENESMVVSFTIEQINDALEWRLKQHYPLRITQPKELSSIAFEWEKMGVRNGASVSKVSDLTKGKFPHVYQFIFSLIHKCLTGKVGSTDQLSLPHLLIMLNLFLSEPFNLAMHLIIAIRDSHSTEGHIGYIRFLSILIGEECARRGIPIEDPAPIRPCSVVFKGSTGWDHDDTKLPVDMLAVIPDCPLKRKYFGLEIPEQEPVQETRSHTAASHIRGKPYTFPIH